MPRDRAESKVDDRPTRSPGFLGRLRHASAWEEIRVRLPERLPLPRGLLVARLIVVLGIIFFSLACVVVVWKLGPLRREAARQASHDTIVHQLRSRITDATLKEDMPRYRDEVAWLQLRLEDLERATMDDHYRADSIADAMQRIQENDDLLLDPRSAPLLIATIDELMTALRQSEAEVARELDRQFDLLTLLVVGALILSTATLLLMERTNRAKEKMAALRYRATHDHLTQGLNRGAIFSVAERELARANRLSRPLTVLLVDLDKFKEINDNHGHAAGDEVIKQAAVTLRRNLRIYDSVGRYGGDEFLIVLPDADESEAGRIAERLCAAFQLPLDLGPVMKRISTSIGGAVHRGSDEQIEALIARADQALYQAKAEGRDGWCMDPAKDPKDGLKRMSKSADRRSSFGNSPDDSAETTA